MQGIQIGHAVDADVPRLLEIRHAAFSRHAPSACSAEEVQTLLADVDETEFREIVSQRQLFVARSATKVLGLAGWKGERLRHVYVDPEQTRRGIATHLVGRVEVDFHQRTGTGQILAGVALHAEKAPQRDVFAARSPNFRLADGNSTFHLSRSLTRFRE